MFIGREKELEFLESKYKSNKGELVILYGRRRIGKTETLREFCCGKENIFFSCSEVPDLQQRQEFSQRLLSSGMPASKYMSEFQDWQTAFRSIKELPCKGKKLVVIDEFPYMCKGNSSIPSILQNLWDIELKDENVLLILCGSSMSFIEKELLAEKNPLYGRATGVYKMAEMDFYDAIKFFPKYSDEEKMTAYAILGGIPHYLRQFDTDLSVAENIKINLLSKGSVLFSEVEFLLKQELRETAFYNVVIEAIAMGATSLNEISTKTQINAQKANVYLKNLSELGIVKREFSVLDGIRQSVPRGRGLYSLTDNYFRFWYSYVFPNMSMLESGDVDGIYNHVVEPSLQHFVSYSFEEVCRQFVRRLNQQGKLPFYLSAIGRWWGKLNQIDANTGKAVSITGEIDVLGFDQKQKSYLVGECKYRNEPIDAGVLYKLTAKSETLKASKCTYCLFSKTGFTDQKELQRDDVMLFDLRQIVKG